MTAETILLVDDDRLILHMCQDALARAGYKTVCLENGDKLAETVAALSPDLIVLDIMMPGTDGLSLCKQLRTGAEPYRGPIIVSSAKHYRADKQMASEVGANAFLEKPFEPERLVDLVGEFLTRKISVRFWGVRGSIPTASRETVGYGGNTPCVELRVAGVESVFIWDGGTGLRELGRSLRGRGAGVCGYLCFSHFHWDHIQGFPFFPPLYKPDIDLMIVGPKQNNIDVRSLFAGQMGPIYFPVPFSAVAAKMSFDHLNEGTWDLDGIHLRTLRVRHPSWVVGYRIEVGDKVVCFIPDDEVDGNGYDVAPGWRERLLEFIRGADLLIHDSMYTDEEYPSRLGWGHSTFNQSVRLAEEGEVKRLLFFHHDPERTDAEMDGIVNRVRDEAMARGCALSMDAAAEGSDFSLEEN